MKTLVRMLRACGLRYSFATLTTPFSAKLLRTVFDKWKQLFFVHEARSY
ncbi:MAG TPA: hypothetical protein VIN08_03600 [Ohtaekwangia sp.]